MTKTLKAPASETSCPDAPTSGLQVIPAAALLGLGLLALPGAAQAAVANPDAYTVTENSTLTGQNVTSNDTAAPGYTVSTFTPPANGSLTLNTDGSFTYTPTAGYTGTDSFTYLLVDSGAPPNAVGTVSLTVVPPAPVPTTGTGALVGLAVAVGALGAAKARKKP